MITTSHHLGDVEIRHVTDGLQPYIVQPFTSIEEYSRFKFGDGNVSRLYGSMLGKMAVNDVLDAEGDGQVYVTSSAYRVAPPASESLLQPFIETVSSEVTGSDLVRFKISKAKLLSENYAGMSLEERSQALQDDLVLPEDIAFSGSRLIILDDIRVTGLREMALKKLLSEAGVKRADFYYVLDVAEGHVYPQTEALINISAVKTVDDILELAQQPDFVPNVRMCKFLLSRPLSEVESFLAAVPPNVAKAIVCYIREDNLREVVRVIP